MINKKKLKFVVVYLRSSSDIPLPVDQSSCRVKPDAARKDDFS